MTGMTFAAVVFGLSPHDPYHRHASHIDGATSILVGIAANQAMESGRMVTINDLFPLR